MKSPEKVPLSDVLAERKSDHIVLAEKARTETCEIDRRFNYEPLFFSHPKSKDKWPSTFMGFSFDYPIWISSMTGGTEHARHINVHLARLAGEFKLGMGLGSCRSLLHDDSRLSDFAVKKYMPDSPLLANLGIAQVEELVLQNKTYMIDEMMKKVEADGLMIHINPLQEWFQPEGDRYTMSPLETLTKFLDKSKAKVVVKEVGQGMGPKSLRALLDLPVAGIELAAFGGTNFTLLERMRGEKDSNREAFIHVGHSAKEMVEVLNALPLRGKEIIISGGIQNVLDGYELLMKLQGKALIGMASAFLSPALTDYDRLKEYFLSFRESLLTAKSVLELKEEQ